VWSEYCNKGIYSVLRDNPNPTIFGDGSSTRDYVHVDDVVRANVLALDNGFNDIINIGTGKQVSLKQLIDKFNSSPIFSENIESEINKIALNVTKAKDILKWEYKIPILEN
jgi:UDP-glucose 4-epimerase